MVQIYFLSILLNLLAGFVVAGDLLDERLSGFTWAKRFFDDNKLAKALLGAGAVIIGVLKLLSVTNGDVPVVGDFLPALTGLGLGAYLLFDYYQKRSSIKNEKIESTDQAISRYRPVLGVFGVLIALVHFFLPGVLFL